MLICPPPVDERSQRAMDLTRGFDLRRSAENTKNYANAVKEVAADLGLAVCDLWTRFMEYAGWKPGDPLPGREDIPPNPKLAELLSDGEWFA
jgi:isoamyl acetate esterase